MGKLRELITISLVLGIVLLMLMGGLVYLIRDFSPLEKALSMVVIGQMLLLITAFVYFIVDAKHDVKMAELQREALMKQKGGAYHYSPQITEAGESNGPSWRPGQGVLGLEDEG